MAQDSTTVFCLTEEEVRIFNDIYDGRDECYDHFVEAVRLMRSWRNLYFDHKARNKQMKQLIAMYQMDEMDYEKALELSAEDMSAISKKLSQAQRKVKRKNMWMYILGGGLLAETAVLAGLIITK